MTQAPKQKSQWLPPASLPSPLTTVAFVLEPLHEKHTERDFRAFMSCRERLRKELQWGTWPPAGFTPEDNRVDLRRHFEEFESGFAFAYTVLSPDRQRCLGCIYIERCDEIAGAQLAFWVTDEAFDIEELLVSEVLNRIHTDWPIDRVLIPLRETNVRGIALAQKLGLKTHNCSSDSSLAEHRCFLSDSASAEQNR